MLKAKKRNDQDSKFVIEGRQRDIQERGHILAKLGVSVFETSANDPKHPRLSMTLDPWFAARKQRHVSADDAIASQCDGSLSFTVTFP